MFIFSLVVLWNGYSRGNRTPGSEKKQMSEYLIKRKIKNKILVVPGTYISPFVLALEGGVNSNPSSRERIFLRTANTRQAPNSCVPGWHKACCRTQETRPEAWSSSVRTDARAWANHITPKPSIISGQTSGRLCLCSYF